MSDSTHVLLTNLLHAWPAIFGYPAMIAAVVLVLLAVVKRKAMYAFSAFLLIAPLSFYITSSPVYWWLGVLIPASVLGLSINIALRNRRDATD